jgi:hypothetical protein
VATALITEFFVRYFKNKPIHNAGGIQVREPFVTRIKLMVIALGLSMFLLLIRLVDGYFFHALWWLTRFLALYTELSNSLMAGLERLLPMKYTSVRSSLYTCRDHVLTNHHRYFRWSNDCDRDVSRQCLPSRAPSSS